MNRPSRNARPARRLAGARSRRLSTSLKRPRQGVAAGWDNRGGVAILAGRLDPKQIPHAIPPLPTAGRFAPPRGGGRNTRRSCTKCTPERHRSLPAELPPREAAAERPRGDRDDSFHHAGRSEEHTSELQSPYDLVCRLLLEKK